MTTTGLEMLDRTVQETHVWLKALLEEIGGTDQHRAYIVLRATLHALRDRLEPTGAAQLAAQLPMLLRGLFYEGWRPADTPTRERHKDAFLQHVQRELPAGMKLDVEQAVRGVFAVMARKIDRGEVAKLAKTLPGALRDLWPQESQGT